MRRKTTQPRQKPSWRKASGEEKFYFIFHNLLSMILFFYIGLKIGLFEKQTFSILDIISFSFVQFLGSVIGLTILLGICARAIIYGFFWVYNYYRNQKHHGMKITTIKSFMDMNQGINEFTTFTYLKIVLYNSIIFCVGVITIIQLKLFKSNSLWAYIGAYAIAKLCVYIWIWIKHK